MKLDFRFNNNIDLLYGLNYCVNRKNNCLKAYNTKEKTPIVTDFYELFQKEYSEDIEQVVLGAGEFQNIAIAAMDSTNIDCPSLRDYLERKESIKKRVIKDILQKPGLNQIDFERIKKFYGFDLGDEIIVYLSFFVSGGFGFMYDNKSIIVLGVKYNSEKDSYGVSGTLVCKLIHEFSHPYIDKTISNLGIFLMENEDTPPEFYKGNYLEESLVRVMEIILSNKIFGEEYERWAVNEQLRAGFTIVPKMLKVYYDNARTIENINDFIWLLIKEKILFINET